MILEIGDKPIKDITPEDLLEIVVIEGCCPYLKVWKRPVILEFDNIMFPDTCVMEYNSYKICDNTPSDIFSFYFEFEDLSFHYSRNYNLNKLNEPSIRLSIKSLSYLIKKGYHIPFDL